MKLLIPCCGRSTRFPGLPPKWLLPGSNGQMMARLAIEKLEISPQDVVLTVLREHEEKYAAVSAIRRNFGAETQIVILDKLTQNQPESVAETIQRLQVREPILIKDCDSQFDLTELEQNYNYVCSGNIRNFPSIRQGNKSYLHVNQDSIILDMAEKKVISGTFSVGGYFFRDPQEFLEDYQWLKSQDRNNESLFISHLINRRIDHGALFVARFVKEYQDWGTSEEWNRSLARRPL